MISVYIKICTCICTTNKKITDTETNQNKTNTEIRKKNNRKYKKIYFEKVKIHIRIHVVCFHYVNNAMVVKNAFVPFITRKSAKKILLISKIPLFVLQIYLIYFKIFAQNAIMFPVLV